MERETGVWRIVFLALPLGVFAVLVIWPLASSFYYAFTNWNGFDAALRFCRASTISASSGPTSCSSTPRSTRRSG